MSETEKVGVVIAGTGLIARFHAQAIRDSALVRLVAVCGRDAARTAAFCAEFGGEAYTDLDAALSRPDIGMLVVATASGAHDEAVFAAARHRVPVLVEKPIAITVARTDAMIAACREAGIPLGCLFQTRWSEEFEEARRKVASGELGRITFARVDVPWWREDAYYTESSWHGTKAMDGGGALINQAIHMVDWLVALMPPVTDVKAFTATLAPTAVVEPVAKALALVSLEAISVASTITLPRVDWIASGSSSLTFSASAFLPSCGGVGFRAVVTFMPSAMEARMSLSRMFTETEASRPKSFSELAASMFTPSSGSVPAVE